MPSLYDKSAHLQELSAVLYRRTLIISICESEPADVPSPFGNWQIHWATEGKSPMKLLGNTVFQHKVRQLAIFLAGWLSGEPHPSPQMYSYKMNVKLQVVKTSVCSQTQQHGFILDLKRRLCLFFHVLLKSYCTVHFKMYHSVQLQYIQCMLL